LRRYGSDDIKAAVATLLFSGSRKTTQDGARLRGDGGGLHLSTFSSTSAVSVT
jgi:hypothetical protein